MRGVRIPHDLNGEDQFVFGLSVTRLAALLFGLLAAYTILHLSLPAPVRLGGATLAALAGAAVAWIRPEGRSLIHWALAAIEFTFTQRSESEPRNAPDSSPEHASSPTPRERHARRPSLSVVTSATARTAMAHSAPPPTRLVPPLSIGELDREPDDDVIELPDSPETSETNGMTTTLPGEGVDASTHPAPVYLGGPQVVTFFSTKGGTGRTTLATEVAALLATKGRYREAPNGPAEPLRVVLVDFDLGSANVSARLGLAQPTMLDYVCDVTVPTPDPREFILRHQLTGLAVMLGPSKCLTGDRAELLGVAQAAHIVSTLKSDGYHFIILDMSASLGDLETYLLETANRIYCVVTPTAGSVQSLYRGVEALRRLGLGAKLHYVANKMRDGINLSEPMSDLNGSLVARIPYDAAFDMAENRHTPVVTRGRGPALEAIEQLAASIYPALDAPTTARSGAAAPFSWFAKRRRAG